MATATLPDAVIGDKAHDLQLGCLALYRACEGMSPRKVDKHVYSSS